MLRGLLKYASLSPSLNIYIFYSRYEFFRIGKNLG